MGSVNNSEIRMISRLYGIRDFKGRAHAVEERCKKGRARFFDSLLVRASLSGDPYGNKSRMFELGTVIPMVRE
jgi:hypothetical protein